MQYGITSFKWRTVSAMSVLISKGPIATQKLPESVPWILRPHLKAKHPYVLHYQKVKKKCKIKRLDQLKRSTRMGHLQRNCPVNYSWYSCPHKVVHSGKWAKSMHNRLPMYMCMYVLEMWLTGSWSVTILYTSLLLQVLWSPSLLVLVWG